MSFVMVELLDIRLLIATCREQAEMVQRLSPNLLPLELLNRTAAAIGCLVPQLPDSILELAINEAASQMGISAA